MASFQIGRQRPQKRKDLHLVLNWGTSAYATGLLQGWQIWEPIESEYLMIYNAFLRILLFLQLQCVTYNVEAAGEEMGTAYLIT